MMDNEKLITKIWMLAFDYDYKLIHSEDDSPEYDMAFASGIMCKESINALQSGMSATELRNKLADMKQSFFKEEYREHVVTKGILAAIDVMISTIDETVPVSELSADGYRDGSSSVRESESEITDVNQDDDIDV